MNLLWLLDQRTIHLITKMSRCAILDIGSNTSKLLVGESTPERGLIELYQSSYSCRILNEKRDGNQLHISNDKITHLVRTVKKLCLEAEKFHPLSTYIVGTEALRITKNISQVKQAILEETGLSLLVLSGIQEAEGIARGITTDPKYHKLADFHAFDLGGGSLEIIEVNRRNVTLTASLPLGSVALMQQLIPNRLNSIDKKLRSQVINSTRKMMAKAVPKLDKCKLLIASGGTIVHLKKAQEVELSKQGNSKEYDGLNRLYIEDMANMMCDLDVNGRTKFFPSIPEDRLDIFPVGLLTILGVMDYLEVDEIFHTYNNLRYGIMAWPELLKKDTEGFI